MQPLATEKKLVLLDPVGIVCSCACKHNQIKSLSKIYCLHMPNNPWQCHGNCVNKIWSIQCSEFLKEIQHIEYMPY